MSETTDLVAGGTQDAAVPTTEAPAASGTTGSARRRGNGLSGMLLPELQRLAAELGISGTGRMRKGDLVAAISARQVGGSAPAGDSPATSSASETAAPATAAPLEAPVSGGANGGVLNGAVERQPAARHRPHPAHPPWREPPRGLAERRRAPWATRSPRASDTAADTAAIDTAPAESDQRTDGDRPQRNRERGGRNRNDRDGGTNRDGGERP